MKKFIISEQEKKQIKGLYNLNEDMVSDFFTNFLTKAGIDTDSKSSPKTEPTKDVEDTDDNTKPDLKRVTNGNVKVVGDYNSEQLRNINYLIDAMNDVGITDPYAQVGILSVIAKESGFIPKSEYSYSKTSNERLRKVFGKRLSKYSDSELTSLKQNDRNFFNEVYGKMIGNKGGDDGYRYRGRGFNQLTGIKNYEKYGNLIGMGDKLVEDPELVNDIKIASKIAIAFFTKGKSTNSFPKFSSKKDSAIYFADINSGGGATSHRDKAIENINNFNVA